MSAPVCNASALARNLLSWFSQNGGWVSSDVQLVYDGSHGFHMVATGPLSSPAVVCCPLKLSLSILNLDPGEVLPVDSLLQQCRGRIPDHILTYLLLIEQRSRGEASPWHVYISCLPGPESMTTPMWFHEDDWVFLQGTSVAPAAQERKQKILRQWDNVVAVFEDLKIHVADDFNSESLLWAATIFSSRAFISTHILPELETVPILFPVIDMLNHSVSAKVEWDFQPHQSFTLKCLDGDQCTAGQELFNNYAPKQNDELLLGYGFCVEDNPIEQFALKLAFPPMLQQYAQEMGLFDARSVPFGMSAAFLENDPNTEQHFLRMRNHPFGRYQNHVPFFRGIPPYVVHFFFIQTVMTLELDLANIDVERPGSRITLQVLVLLHQAIEQRSRSLPLCVYTEPRNDKQKYAKIYRDGQAKIIHSILEELNTVVYRLRKADIRAPLARPSLLSIADGLLCLEAIFPRVVETFRIGIEKHDLHDPQDASMIWTLFLLATIAPWLAMNNPEEAAFPQWAGNVLSKHPLPALEDGIEDAETYGFIDENFGDFCRIQDADSSPLEMLDDLGPTFRTSQAVAYRGFISGPTENLGVRLIMWGMKVVEQDLLSVLEDGAVKKCLFVQSMGADGVLSDEWMYEDASDGATGSSADME